MTRAKLALTRRRLVIAAAAFAATDPTEAMSNNISDLSAKLEKAIQGGGVLRLREGTYLADGLLVDRPLLIEGVPGRTVIAASGSGPAFTIRSAGEVMLRGLSLRDGDGAGTADRQGVALVAVSDTRNLVIEGCTFGGTAGSALHLERTGGRVSGNRLEGIGQTAIFAQDSSGLEISGNQVSQVGNNGIQVWRTEPGEDGTLVLGNQVSHVEARSGGSGQNGNGINIYRAANVTIHANRVSDCAFSAIRNNAGANCVIGGNSISRTGEVAIYCEFGFEGAVVSGNLLEDVAFGISITNFDAGGRLAVVSGNVVRKVKGGGAIPATTATAISAEADTTVTGNVIEDARDTGINLGWGKYARNLSASGNTVRACGTAIGFSVSDGAGPVMVTGNRIDACAMAIRGHDHGKTVTAELALAGAAAPGQSVIEGNLVT
jgi:uncharacterized secreted repeat protein (TIGR03808 family)